MSSATATQMNVRIDASLKERGDEGLSAAGYNPTSAVRELWQFAANHAHEPQKIRAFMSSIKASEKVTKNGDAVREWQEERSVLLAKAGISVEALRECPFESLSYDELREQAMLERLEEGDLRG